MSLQILKTRGLRLLDKLLVERRIARHKGHVHHRAVFAQHRVREELRLIEEVVEQRRLLLVPLLHGREAADLLDPAEHLAADVNVVAGRCVVERAVCRIGLIAQHGRRAGQAVSDQILAHHRDGHAGRSHILLDAAPKDAVIRNLFGRRKEAGGDIGDQGLSLSVRRLMEDRAVNRIVFAEIEIVRIRPNRQIRAVRDIAVNLILARRDSAHIAVERCLLHGFLGPLSGDNVLRLAVFHEV